MNFIKADFDGVITPKLKNAKVGKLCCQNTCSDIVLMKISPYTLNFLAILLSKILHQICTPVTNLTKTWLVELKYM